MDFIRKHVHEDGTLLITDEYKAYNAVRKTIVHGVINHSKRYVDGYTHTNTIEGFWSLVKRAWFGSHHHYSEKFVALFAAETAWKYNNRKNPEAFNDFLGGCFS